MALLLISACTSETADTTLKPDDNRFTKVVLAEGLDEPMEMTFLNQHEILVVERKGGVRLINEQTGENALVTMIPVNTKYKNKEGRVREAEEGLMGVIAHPQYEENRWIYMYYADPDDTKHVLARWELHGDSLYHHTKKIMLEVPTQREECCHTGGGMVFDEEGNLYLTVGNNTVNPRTGSSNLDERPGHENSDDQRAPGNTNDLRGKILRIHPEDDGSYTIPEGNLYPVGTDKTRPEIYTMGHRNPWRPTLDSKTGYLYWGEVGPDASIDSVWGPRGYDEFNQAKGPGFFGWPYFLGDNYAYNEHDLATDTYGPPFDTANPVNNSVNNTGLVELPKPVPAFIWYPYGPSEEFPMLGSAGRSATGGPVYRQADFTGAPRPFPAYYEGKWFIVDFMRDWTMAVTMDEKGDYVSMERFLPDLSFDATIDVDFGPSGDLYFLDYGSAWFRYNENSSLYKIEYNSGNRKPQVVASVDQSAGPVPLTVALSSEGTMDYDDYDQGELKYEWIVSEGEETVQTLTGPEADLTLENPGVYQVVLKVTDTKGDHNQISHTVVAGNTPPAVAIDLNGVNESFYFRESDLDYVVSVKDAEDGNTADGSIAPGDVAVTFDYLPAGYDPVEMAQNHAGADMLTEQSIGKNLIETNDCKSCHQYEQTSIGPSYVTVAEKYEATPQNVNMLVKRVINGSTGIWGEHAMSAHPQLSEVDAKRMVDFILTLAEEDVSTELLPLEGVVSTDIPGEEEEPGGFLLRASYSDRGNGNLPPLSRDGYVALRSSIVNPQMADRTHNTQLLTTPRTNFFIKGQEAFVAFDQVDLTGIEMIEFFVQAQPRVGAKGGLVEVHLDSPDGPLIGRSESLSPRAIPRRWGGNDDLTRDERRRMSSDQLQVSIDQTSGRQDVYFVFKNPQASDNDVQMALIEIQFYDQVPEL